MTNSVSAAEVVVLPTESPKEASSDGSMIDYFGEMKGLMQETRDLLRIAIRQPKLFADAVSEDYPEMVQA